ncbi:glycosyltransferase family 4 protein [candidate division TA06 bacterium]|nr:glycosyltransferase family 4 protein [candidate division TA06 bacterium]
MRKVLVIAYYFPPMGMGGVQRTLKFCKYLPTFGWKPIVLTIEETGYFAHDPSLLEEVKGKAKIYRTVDPLSHLARTPNHETRNSRFGRSTSRLLSSWFLFPDSKIGWLPFAFLKGLKIIQKEGIDLLFASAPPYTALLTGWLLKRRTGLPLILDFRDPWTESFFLHPPTPFHRRLHEELERSVLQVADQIISVNDPLGELLDKKLTSKGKGKVTVIPHGYDSEDFKKIQHPASSIQHSAFSIVHVGTLNKWARPDPLLQAVKGLLEEKKLKRSDLEVHFVGFASNRDLKISQEIGLEDIVKFTPYLPHTKSLRTLLDADLLWLTIRGESDRGGQLRSTGKLYEYLGSRRPIIASVPLKGAAAKTIRETGAGVVVDPDDIEGLKKFLYDYYLKKKNGDLRETPVEKVEIYERKKLTEKLSQVFEVAMKGITH